MRVKICGITTVADALAADLAGADAIGLIFFRGSKRYIELDTATSIAHAVSPYISINALQRMPLDARHPKALHGEFINWDVCTVVPNGLN